jgi:hypothetical protein
MNTIVQGLDSVPGTETPDGAEQFFVRASTTTPFEIEGDDPTSPPGDTLTVDLTGVVGYPTVSHGIPDSTITFGSGRMPITYREIETFITTSGKANHIFDLLNYPTGNVFDVELTDVNTLQVSLDGTPVFSETDGLVGQSVKDVRLGSHPAS